MCGRLPGKRIVCSASKVTTCSSVYQTCQVVVNSMLHQQGDNTVIMYQSCHAHGVRHGHIMSRSWRPPRPPSETTSLALASRSAASAFVARMDVRSAAARRTLRRRAAVTMAGAAMLSHWWLQEQMLDGAMRADGGWRRTR